MTFYEWLDSRAERRAAHRHFLIEQGRDWRSILLSVPPSLVLALIIIILFAWAFAREEDPATRNLMVGALIAGFAAAWQFYLGSSNSAGKANDRADRATEAAQEAVRRMPAPSKPDAELAPGEQITVGAPSETEILPSGPGSAGDNGRTEP